MKISIFYIRFGLFSLCFWHVLRQNPNLIKNIFYSFSFIYFLLIFDGFIQYFSGQNLIGFELAPGPRVSSFFGDELILGSYLSRLFPIYFATFVLLFKANYKKKIIIPATIFILSEVMVYISGERTSFFYLNFSAIIMITLIKDFKKIRIITYIFSILLIIFISTFNESTKNRIFDETLSQIGFNSSEGKKYVFSIQHQHHYETALKIYRDNIVFGSGIKTFRYLCDNPKYKISNYSCSTHPHNIYVQVLTETGLFGFLFIFSVFIFLSLKLFQHLISSLRRKTYFSDFQICLLTAVLISLWPFVPTGSFFNNFMNIIYFYPAGMILWSFNKNKIIYNKI